MTTSESRPPQETASTTTTSIAQRSDTAPLTRAEQSDLLRIARQRARVSKAQLEAHGARLIADFEADMAARYSASAEAWRDLTEAANAACEAADAELARRCEALGIRPEFRPRITATWYSRGESADRQRRTELRKVAQTEVAASIKAAKVTIDAAELDAAERIITAGMRGVALEVLDTIPTPADLLAPLDLDAIEAMAPTRKAVSW